MSLDGLGQHTDEKELVLEAFLMEENSRVPKELAWAGDGIQVWLQLLFHVYRVRSYATIVLDEPEVYLHPDLQRRLVRLLEATGRQVILATHSAEMLSEADLRLVTLIDKKGRASRKAKNDGDLEMLTSTLGTAFNLRLARALRSKVALFVEGLDMGMLRRLAKTAGCTALEREAGVTVIELGGYSRWGQVEPFAWLCTELLPDALKVFVILDRDYRSDAVVEEVEAKFAASGLIGHVWRKKELESYLLTAAAIARLSGDTAEHITVALEEITAGMENEVFSKMLSERMVTEVSAEKHRVSVMVAFKAEFDPVWQDPEFRRNHCPPKQVIARLNERLQGTGHKAVSFSALARAHRVDEIDKELLDALRAVEQAAAM